tara:strand:- start:908 stop:1102 length:195 start_codon:yes stop_codon:yes gene_type:complete
MDINSQIKSRSITSKASSACKMNMGLVYGAADLGDSKGFVDHAAAIEKKFSKKDDKVISPEEEA